MSDEPSAGKREDTALTSGPLDIPLYDHNRYLQAQRTKTHGRVRKCMDKARRDYDRVPRVDQFLDTFLHALTVLKCVQAIGAGIEYGESPNELGPTLELLRERLRFFNEALRRTRTELLKSSAAAQVVPLNVFGAAGRTWHHLVENVGGEFLSQLEEALYLLADPDTGEKRWHSDVGPFLVFKERTLRGYDALSFNLVEEGLIREFEEYAERRGWLAGAIGDQQSENTEEKTEPVAGERLSGGDGGRNVIPSGREDSYVPISSIYHYHFDSYGKAKRFLNDNPEIRTRKPTSQRLDVHAADWHKCLAKRQPADEEVDKVIEEVEERKREIDLKRDNSN